MWSTCHEHGTKKKSESPRGIEPETFRSPLRYSNHWATMDLWRAGPYTNTSHEPCKWQPCKWLELPTGARKVTGSIPVEDSDFLFVRCLWHVDYITYHDYCCFPLLQNWFAFSNLHKPLFTEHGYIPFPNKNPPLDEMNNAYCKVRIALYKITLTKLHVIHDSSFPSRRLLRFL